MMVRTIVAVALFAAAFPATAQERAGAPAEAPVAERYARAARLLTAPAAGAVKNMNIVPRWIAAEDRFWYLRQTQTGVEFVLVDAATGAKTPAFDHAGLAAALSPLLKTKVSPDALPFTDFAYAPDRARIMFAIGAARFTCTVAATVCTADAPSRLEAHMIASPDGRSAVFQQGGNLWLRDLATGADRALTSDGVPLKGWAVPVEPNDFRALRRAPGGSRPFWTSWSPDGTRLITSFVDQSFVEPYPFIEYAPVDGGARPRVHQVRLPLVGDRKPTVQLFAIEVATGARTRLDLDATKFDALELVGHVGDWSPDGQRWRLAALWPENDGASLWEANTVTGRAREVIREAGRYPALLNAGGYGHPALAFVAGGRQVIWPSQRSGFMHLYLYDMASGRQLRRLTTGDWLVRDLLRADDRLRRIFFTAQGRDGRDPYHRSIYSVGYDGGTVTRLSPDAADHLVADPRTSFPAFDGARAYDPVSQSGRYLAYYRSTLTDPGAFVLLRIGGAAQVLELADARALLALGYRPPQPFTVKAADGRTDLYGAIYRPANFDPARRYPVLLAQYNSPMVTVTPHNFGGGFGLPIDNATPAAEAELGFIVVMIDPRGTPFRGAAFSNPPATFLADMGLRDQVAAIRDLARRDLSLDLTRVGVVGASFGAWTAVRALIEHPDFFKAAVAWASPGGFGSMYYGPALTNSAGAPRFANGDALATRPGDRPVNWAGFDPIAQIGRMRGRLLFGTGALDENVLPGSQLQFFDAAARAGRDVEQMFLPRATHGPMPYWPYVVKRTWDFLIRNVGGESPPDNWTFPPGAFPPVRPDQQ